MLAIMKRGLVVGLETTWTLGKIIFPITLIVTMLSYTTVFHKVAHFLTPFMSWFGLSGEVAIPLVLGNLLNLYAGIGAVLTMDLTVKEVFIFSVMLSFSHNLLVETAVAAKVGIRMSIVLAIRIGLALLSGILINLFWQGGSNPATFGFIPTESPQELSSFWAIVLEGMTSATTGIFSIALIVIPIMVFIQMMKEKNGLHYIMKTMRPLTKFIGVKENTSMTLAAGLLFGLAYGAGVMIQAAKEDDVSKKDLYLLFTFLIACHAVVEDTLLFVPLGIPVLPLLLFRFMTAILLTAAVSFLWSRLAKSKEKAKGKEVTL